MAIVEARPGTAANNTWYAIDSWTSYVGGPGRDTVNYARDGFLIEAVFPLSDMRFGAEPNYRVEKALGRHDTMDFLAGIEVITGWTHPIQAQTTGPIVRGTNQNNSLIFGTDGNDYIECGRGNDGLRGGGGSDTYFYARGDGNDTISEVGSGDINTLVFGAGILPEHVTFSREANVGTVKIHIGSNTITLTNQLFNPAIQLIKFSDPNATVKVWEMNRIGIEYTAAPAGGRIAGVDEKADGLSGALISDVITGSNNRDLMSLGDGDNRAQGRGGNDEITGGIDNDSFNGGAGNDELDGRGGFDTLTGGAGSDTFVFRGSGCESLTRTTITDYDPSEGDILDLSNFRDNDQIVQAGVGTLVTFEAEDRTQILLLDYFGDLPFGETR